MIETKNPSKNVREFVLQNTSEAPPQTLAQIWYERT